MKIFKFLIPVFIVSACTEPEVDLPPVPKIVSPSENEVFYPTQEFKISWEVPDSSSTIEMQLIGSEDSTYFDAGDSLFSKLTRFSEFSPNASYSFIFDPALSESIFYGFRLRNKKDGLTSNWTEVRYFRVDP
jgi:hypothetical protein